MESFRWDPCFVTGLDEVDEQHHRLVDLINVLGDRLMAEAGASLAEIQAVIVELADYAAFHFRQEEEMMKAVGIDPRTLDDQQSSHVGFVREVRETAGLLSPESVERATGLHSFLIHWLAHHILATDQSMARQIFAIRSGRSAAEAFAAEEASRPSATDPFLHALDGLFQRVSERNRELSRLNETLEARVRERTRTLAETAERLAEANRKLEDVANTDPLTGLANRRRAMEQLDREWQSAVDTGAPLSCMMIDADHFKEINDTHGHDAGDEVLRRLARELRYCVRTDDLVCRLGGDEFLILCPRTPLEGAFRLAEHVRLAVAALRVPAGDGAWNGSISVGVATRRDGMGSIQDLLKAADEGVYIAKRMGRNAVATGLPRRLSDNPPPSHWHRTAAPS